MANAITIAERLNAYLGRSGRQLLNIWIDLKGNSSLQRRIELITKAIAHIHRLRQFLFTPANNFPIDDFLLLVKNSAAQNLELFSLTSPSHTSMHLYQSVGPDGNGSLNSLILKGGAPKLKTLWIDTTVQCFIPPTQNITTLYIKQDESINHFASWRIMLPLFSTPNLTTLALDASLHMCYIIDTTGSSLPLVSPHLKTLRICNHGLFGGMGNWRADCLETLIFENVRFHGIHNVDPELGNYAFPSLYKFVTVNSAPSYQKSGVTLTKSTSNIMELLISDNRRCLPRDDFFLVNLLKYDENCSEIPRPALQELTLKIRSMERWGPVFFSQCLHAHSQLCPITLKLDSSILENWKEENRTFLEELEHTYTIKPLDSSISSIHVFWPIHEHNGPFSKSFERFDSSYIRKYSYEKLLS